MKPCSRRQEYQKSQCALRRGRRWTRTNHQRALKLMIFPLLNVKMLEKPLLHNDIHQGVPASRRVRPRLLSRRRVRRSDNVSQDKYGRTVMTENEDSGSRDMMAQKTLRRTGHMSGRELQMTTTRTRATPPHRRRPGPWGRTRTCTRRSPPDRRRPDHWGMRRRHHQVLVLHLPLCLLRGLHLLRRLCQHPQRRLKTT